MIFKLFATRAAMAGVVLGSLTATPAAAVTVLTYDFGGGPGVGANVLSKVATAPGNKTLTATARKFSLAPGSLTNLSQTRTANAAANSPAYTLRATPSGIGVSAGADTNQLDTNSAGTTNSPLREGILVSSSIPNFSLRGLQLSFVDADDTLQVYGVKLDGSFVDLGYGGVIRATNGVSLSGAATGTNSAANSATTVLTLNNPTANFARYFFTTRVGGDVQFMGTLGQGYRIESITGSVPEPATWGLLITGFTMVGVASRRRRMMTVS